MYLKTQRSPFTVIEEKDIHEIMESFKCDDRFINAYMRYKHCPNARIIMGEDYSIIEDEGWVIPTLMSEDNLVKALKKTMKETKLESLKFGGVPFEQYEALKPHMDISWDEICYLYVYRGNPFEDTYENRNETNIRPLTLEDAELVYKYYSYKEHDDIDYVKTIIENMPTRGIWIDGELVSWVVQRDEGSIGIMYTLKEHRHKGYAIDLTKSLINEIIKRGDIPFVHIVVGNEASCKLAEKVGFKRSSTVVWFEGRFK